MATWANLTQEQRDVYSVFEHDLRSLAGETQRLFNKYASMKSRFDEQMAGILVALDDNTVVPNSSGLAGASSLDSDADMVAVYNDFTGMLTTYNTAGKQQKRAKACGQANM